MLAKWHVPPAHRRGIPSGIYSSAPSGKSIGATLPYLLPLTLVAAAHLLQLNFWDWGKSIGLLLRLPSPHLRGNRQVDRRLHDRESVENFLFVPPVAIFVNEFPVRARGTGATVPFHVNPAISVSVVIEHLLNLFHGNGDMETRGKKYGGAKSNGSGVKPAVGGGLAETRAHRVSGAGFSGVVLWGPSPINIIGVPLGVKRNSPCCRPRELDSGACCVRVS